ncbi:MAG TPA: glycine cleavage system protein H, partial [bacterium]|nr:glycine cleavage system protein H [bacterium]
MAIPGELKYSKEHEWVRVEGDVAVVGITDHAQEALGEVVYLELPAKGEKLAKDKAFGVVESTKAVSDIYAPISG